MALEYAKMKTNTRVITLYPARANDEKKEQQVARLIRDTIPIVYEKTLNLNDKGLYNFISQLYFEEPWLSDGVDPLAGVKHQTYKCTGNSSVKVLLVETPSIEVTQQLKEDIRDIYGIGKPSVHINDNFRETLRISRIAFNENSIYFLNHGDPLYSPKLSQLLNIYRSALNHYNLNSDDFCVTGSAVMTLFGIRDCTDLDYLHMDPRHVLQGNKLIGSHETELSKYPLHKHDIVLNPFNHFYWNNVKFATLNVVKSLKAYRGEEKDIKDVELIEGVL